MNVPNAFNELCRAFHQDILLVHETFEAAVHSCSDHLTKGDAEIARAFIEALLRNDTLDQTLDALWLKSPSDWHVSGKGGVRQLLELMSRSLEERLRSPE